jgi:hypothetical protein
MTHLEASVRINSQSLRSQIKQLRTGLDLVEAEIKILEESETAVNESIAKDLFVEKMKNFLETAKPRLAELESGVNEADTKTAEVLQMFGEDPATTSFEDFLSILLQFSSSCGKARKEIEDAVKKQAQKEKQLSPGTKRKAVASPVSGENSSAAEAKKAGIMMEKGDLENAIKQMKAGGSVALRKNRRTIVADNNAVFNAEGDSPKVSSVDITPEKPLVKNLKPTLAGRDNVNALATEAILKIQQQRANLEKTIEEAKNKE